MVVAGALGAVVTATAGNAPVPYAWARLLTGSGGDRPAGRLPWPPPNIAARSPGAGLVVLSTRQAAGPGGALVISGTVLNRSAHHRWDVVASLVTWDATFAVVSRDAAAVTPAELGPGGVGTFSLVESVASLSPTAVGYLVTAASRGAPLGATVAYLAPAAANGRPQSLAVTLTGVAVTPARPGYVDITVNLAMANQGDEAVLVAPAADSYFGDARGRRFPPNPLRGDLSGGVLIPAGTMVAGRLTYAVPAAGREISFHIGSALTGSFAVFDPTGGSPQPPNPACRTGNPLANVYHPYRLLVQQGCLTVTGTVDFSRHEGDGDWHINVRLDSAYARLLNWGNEMYEHGDLVVEIVPADQPWCTPGEPPYPPSGDYDYGHCTGAAIPVPADGARVTVTGPYVMDADHGWMEIHPVWQMLMPTSSVLSPH